MIGYFQSLAEWTRKRNEALKAVRDAYHDTLPKRWQFLLGSKARRKIQEDTQERLRMARETLSDTEHTKPERPEMTTELFKYEERDEK